MLKDGSEETEVPIHNLYLDSPEDDFHDLTSRPESTFYAPAYKDASNFLICLVLQLGNDSAQSAVRVYSRVGVISVPWEDSPAYDLSWIREESQRIRIK